MMYLKQSTAVTAKIGPFLDSTDGVTAEGALTVEQADVRLSKNGGNIAQKNDASACTHDELGYYDCPLDATDTGTLGRLQLMISSAGALPVWHDFMVVTANVYDTLCSTDNLDVTGEIIEGALTLKQAIRLILAVLAGKASGGGTTTLTFKDTTDATSRVIATVDPNGNRTAVTLDAT
jgi:hypothetical protein